MNQELAKATPAQPVRVGRYRVTGLIGEGGMGTVYDAVDAEHGGRVALKTLTHLEPNNLLRFKNEFRSVADLSHPNLVSLNELSCHDDLWYFTMERVDGVDFLEWLRGAPVKTPTPAAALTIPGSSQATRRADERDEPGLPRLVLAPPPSLPKLRHALTQLVAAVHALHQAGLLHQDLKPSNVLVDTHGRVVVLDFGLVRALDAAHHPIEPLEGSVSISGTPMWMAPEQFLAGPTGAAADWYAVGLMLYMGLTGAPAFPQADAVATGYARQYLTPQAPAERVAGVPKDLSTLTLALLATDPADRPTGDTLIELLSGDETSRSRAARQIAGTRFVGRIAERRILRDAFAHAAAGNTSTVHVSAVSGTGKTALVQRGLEDARAEGGLVLRGRCYERENVPYKAFDGLLDDLALALAIEPADEVSDDLPHWIAELAGVFPALTTVPAIAERIEDLPAIPSSVSIVQLRRRAVEALRELFIKRAARRPLVLEIDDLQWADADSITLLTRLLAAPAPPGLMVAVCLRAEEASENVAVAQYLADASVPRDDISARSIALGPLDADEAATLADGILAALHVKAQGLAAAIAAESAGVPFFVEELARYAAEHHKPGATSASLIAGVSLDKVLAWRVRSLPSAERSLVETLCVANSPIPLSVAFEVADVESTPLRALWSLRGKRLLRSTGAAADDGVEIHHDQMRESVVDYLGQDRTDELHLRLGRALATRAKDDGESPWLFDAVRHLNAVAGRLEGEERRRAAGLNLEAGRTARRAGAFALAFDCFGAGATLLGAAGWDTDYELALALASGAAESAYLSSSWDAVEAHVATVKARGRTLLDQLDAWEVEIDAGIARRDYAGAVDSGLELLRLLGVDLPAHPGEAEVGEAFGAAMTSLAGVGPAGLMALGSAEDPEVVAAMRIEARIVSAAYFGRPMLLPVLACRLVTTAVAHGLAPSTAYALSVYGIVLNTLGMHPDAHTWGGVALDLLNRFEDRSFEARTRHVVHNLVCVWTIPLRDTLSHIRRVVDVGKETGDIEYAGYAGHAHVHNEIYCGRPLAAAQRNAENIGAFMRGHEEVNALHYHVLFEQLLRNLLGQSDDPTTLDGPGFSETDALAAAEAAESHSGQCLTRIVMGVTRYTFGAVAEASRLFEEARPVRDGIASTWHVPIFLQFAALSIHGLPPEQREPLRAAADEDLAALRALAEHGAANFAHRVALVEAECARADGRFDDAIEAFDRALALAEPGGWQSDVALAHELASRCYREADKAEQAEEHLNAARAAYQRWGAVAKVAALSSDS